MGRLDPSRRPAAYNETPEYHPIWRGVGFAMLILIPIISYAASVVLFNLNLQRHWIAVPRELVINVLGDPYLIMKILLAIIIAFVIYVIFLGVTYFANRFFGPPRYGPLDVPPIRVKTRRSR
jgi:hypothetical protein